MDILNDEEDQDTIAWLPHGRSFIIYKKKKFACKFVSWINFVWGLATEASQAEHV